MKCAYLSLRGPVIVVRLELGAHSHGKLSNGVVINNRLSSGQCKEVRWICTFAITNCSTGNRNFGVTL